MGELMGVVEQWLVRSSRTAPRTWLVARLGHIDPRVHQPCFCGKGMQHHVIYPLSLTGRV